ncbi:hypothetical protein N7508_007753 [Penicillium antarcticum]|uniref:uncharacterized protein n=1 Tax=Penicillium antarcticum TaxID=416450 RepID=UPI00239444BC|nr:uncharacterized protein N7508_007753 [Penicillium antarcticum]KAJ5297504.1 hypothetical protein N7508_007753 [Penicillium antarcticum]
MEMRRGTTQLISLTGVAVLVCVWYLHKRQLSRESTRRDLQPKISAQKKSKVGNRPALDILYPNSDSPNAEDAEIDIVAVHGLGSNVDWSWTWKDDTQIVDGKPRLVNWLSDNNMLPKKVPRARVLAYNYESRWHLDAATTRLQVCGKHLAEAIHEFREDSSDRPLIFIGHSLGGNVIQHALLYAETEQSLKYLVELTVGLIFLGCPFKGSKIQQLATVVIQSLKLAGADEGINGYLGYGSTVLLDKVDSFQRLMERNSIPFCAFIEQRKTDYGNKIYIPGLIKDLVVNEESAGALGPHKVHLNTDHFKINKYSGPQDRSFLSVSAKITEMYKGWRPLIASRMSGPESGVQRKLKFNKERHERIVNFLAKFDFSARYSDVFLNRHKNTGQWILETESFQQWLLTAGKTLWCPGIPGAGKTTLFAIAVNYLQERFYKKEDAILFAFCDYKDRLNQTAHNILLSLWRQLMQNRILTEAECERLETTYLKRAVIPTTDTVLNMLSDEMSKYSRVFIMLDALDELTTESRDELLYLISNLPKNKKLLVTSRVPKEKTSPFSDVPQLEIRAKETDLTEYIDGRLQSSRLASKLMHNNKLKRDIKDTVIKKANGMFLLVKLHLNALADQHTTKGIHASLRRLPEGENAISRTYEDAISRISDQPQKDRELGEMIILWITHAQRPLSLKDLQYALTLQEGDDEIDPQDLIPGELLTSTCAGLVTIEDVSGRIQFTHSTAQEYLDSIKSAKFPSADAYIAKRCIQYLSLSMFCTDTKEIHTTGFFKTIAKFPFLEYAALHWGLHAKKADDNETKNTITKAVQSFFNLKLQSIFAVRTLLCGIAGVDGAEMGDKLARTERSIKLVNIAAYFGLDFLIANLVVKRSEVIVESFDDFVGNVLHWAAFGQHDTTLALLLNQPSISQMLNQKGYSQFTPLHMALVHRRDHSAEILLDHGADVTARAHFDHTPLLIAALNGNGAMIPKILSKDKGIDTLLVQAHGGTTPFRAAAGLGHKDAMVELLRALDSYELSEDLDELRDDFGRNPLHMAAEHGYLNICEVLLKSKYGPQLAISVDWWGAPPVALSILHGHVQVTETFLTWNDGALMKGEEGFVSDALLMAARWGQPFVVDMLLKRHPESYLMDFQSQTVLHHAAFSGSLDTVKIVLRHSGGRDMLEVRDKTGNTALLGACRRGLAEIVEYLIMHGAMMDTKNDNEETALHHACETNVQQVITILLQSGIDSEAKRSDGQTALDVAIVNDALEAIQVLLNAGIHVPEGITIPEIPPWRNIAMVKEYHPETPKDQFEAYFYLKMAASGKLSSSLLSHIFDLAEYWLVSETERVESKCAARQHGDTMVYLRSAPIFGNLHHPVRRIDYEVISHDQGYSGDSHLHGQYDGSYTWFDASRECSPGPFEQAARRIPGPEILRNVHASYAWHKHRVIWCSTTGESYLHVRTDKETKEEIEEPVATVRYDHRQPKPVPLKWISEINPGDRLVMNAIAMFPGWENHIQRAKAIIHTSCLKASAQT